jgi:hypothetical protein
MSDSGAAKAKKDPLSAPAVDATLSAPSYSSFRQQQFPIRPTGCSWENGRLLPIQIFAQIEDQRAVAAAH